ncbi:MAG TPA: phosphatase PAP2 family protein [Alphaproteobacteria bacterium]|nr:phosphatase PAP2 family protein [Alphaproteobacteria bacterium]
MNRTTFRIIFIALAIIAVLAIAAFVPHLDVIVSGWFYKPGHGFALGHAWVFEAIHYAAFAGARVLGAAFVILFIAAAVRRRPVLGLNAKACLFLFLALVIGPGLVANVALKDHWGRARPRDITAFAGDLQFTPALVPSDQCPRNCSFVCGDCAFGFFLTAFAYVAPEKKRRRFFWAGMAAGGGFALARLADGAHFLSDALYAAFFMLLTTALLHMAMYGPGATRRCWRDWLFFPAKPDR